MSVPHHQAAGNLQSETRIDWLYLSELGLTWFSKVVVVATFLLILVGALVTTHDAGMAVPDWPLSFGSLNPDGWWEQFHVRLEHGHRLFAAIVGLLVGVLCAWIWQSWRSLLVAALVAVVLHQAGKSLGAPRSVMMHLSIWPPAIAFFASVLWHARGRALRYSRGIRTVALISFVCVCAQATLGGFRVTQETAGAIQLATILRIAHGIFAQTFLCVNVAAAALLAARWRGDGEASPAAGARFVRTWAWAGFGAVFLQLIFAAIMRHLGAGLAIPTFPAAALDGSWLPAVHNAYIDLNFLHTRIGALVVTILVLVAAISAYRHTPNLGRLVRPASGIAFLVLVQVALGIFVIWHTKPPTLTSLHVVNGAALLATTLLLAIRASHALSPSRVPDRAIPLHP